MFYNLQAINCVQKVAGYPGKRSAVAEPNTEFIGPDGSLLVSSHGLAGVNGLTPGVVGPEGSFLVNGQYLKPSVVRPDGRPLVFGKRSAVTAPEVVPTFNLAPTLIHAPTHDTASIESHHLGGNFAYPVAEVHAESGLSPSERNKRMKMPVGMVDEIKWPEISKDQKRTSPSKIKK